MKLETAYSFPPNNPVFTAALRCFWAGRKPGDTVHVSVTGTNKLKGSQVPETSLSVDIGLKNDETILTFNGSYAGEGGLYYTGIWRNNRASYQSRQGLHIDVLWDHNNARGNNGPFAVIGDHQFTSRLEAPDDFKYSSSKTAAKIFETTMHEADSCLHALAVRISAVAGIPNFVIMQLNGRMYRVNEERQVAETVFAEAHTQGDTMVMRLQYGSYKDTLTFKILNEQEYRKRAQK